MIELLAAIVAALALLVSLSAFFTVMDVLFAARIDRTYEMTRQMPGRSLLVGLVNAVFLGTMILAFWALGEWSGNPLPHLFALILLSVLAVGAAFGLAGVVRQMAKHLAPQTAGVRMTMWGAVPLALACALPFVGWFLLLPYVSLLGLGAFVLSFFSPTQLASSAE